MPFESLLVGVEHKGRAWLMIGHWFCNSPWPPMYLSGRELDERRDGRRRW